LKEEHRVVQHAIKPPLPRIDCHRSNRCQRWRCRLHGETAHARLFPPLRPEYVTRSAFTTSVSLSSCVCSMLKSRNERKRPNTSPFHANRCASVRRSSCRPHTTAAAPLQTPRRACQSAMASWFERHSNTPEENGASGRKGLCPTPVFIPFIRGSRYALPNRSLNAGHVEPGIPADTAQHVQTKPNERRTLLRYRRAVVVV